MRVAEQKNGCLLQRALRLKVIPVHDERVAVGPQRSLQYLTSLVADGREEAVVGRALHEDIIARERQCLDGGRRGGDDPTGIDNPVAVYRPVMASLKP